MVSHQVKYTQNMKRLLFLLFFISIVSFGQNPPVIISSDFQKLNDKETEQYMLSTYFNLTAEDVSFSNSYFKIKNRSVVFIGKDTNYYDNILITIARGKTNPEEFLPEFLPAYKKQFNEEKEKMGLSFEINKSGLGTHQSSKLKYGFISSVQVWEKFEDSLNYKRNSSYYYIKLSKEVKLEITINSKKKLSLDDILIDILPFKDYYKIGLAKFNNKDYLGAVESYNNAIGFFGKTRLILFQRGNAKRMLEDYESAVEDYNLSIEIKPDAGIYYNRAICKYYLNNKFGACQDALKAEEFGFDASKMTKAACN
jgi:tetratricopeptide (TPR) repeat protein